MKRIILLATLMLLGMPSFAQLDVKSKSSALTTVCSLRMGVVKCYFANGKYMLSIKSTNQFDDSELFYLGKDKESSLATLDDLIKFAEDADDGAAITANDALNKEWFIMKIVTLGASNLSLKTELQAGDRYVGKKELMRIRDKISQIY